MGNIEKTFHDLVELCEYLRGRDGCPWDREQTLRTLKAFIIEEAYEVVEAIESDDADELEEELGDLCYQIIFASQICKEEGKFDIDDVVNRLYSKLVRRHPHVFGEEKAKNAEDALKRWHCEKLKEGPGKTELLEIPRSMPSLLRAQRVGEKASHVGFDWNGAKDVIDKVKEELNELQIELESGKKEQMEKEWGDLIFSLVNLARHLNIDAETASHRSIDNFIRRFRDIEEMAKDMNKDLSELSNEEMDELWVKVKDRT
ncbi:MAG: nucleoside triphosphate pyrophosphohydrolase [Deltaproteobacteria bacterium]|nr:nucleoside triphosphate pyrophosphohydrolase [Deltaproteobacteria bacterium]